MIPALGNICQIMIKHLHMSICCRNAWAENIIMNEDIFRELQFWYIFIVISYVLSVLFQCIDNHSVLFLLMQVSLQELVLL
jgi:hypothetical protein